MVSKYLKSSLLVAHYQMIPQIRILSKILIYGNYFIISLFVLLLIQVTFYDYYSLKLLQSIVLITFSEAIFFLGVLSFKFLDWSIPSGARKQTVVTWLYTISILILLLNSIFTLSFVLLSLTQYNEKIVQHGTEYISYIDNSHILKVGFQVTLIMVFISFWISTSVLLSKYITKVGKIRYMFLTLLPLLYFLIPFIPGLIDWLSVYQSSNPITFAIAYTLFFSNSVPIAAIFFGLAFWSIGRTMENSHIKNYMYMAGYGVVLFFISNQAVLLISAPYPPTILPYLSVIGFSSYLMLIGIFSSSISYVQDSDLRKRIQKTIQNEFVFMKNIGSHEMEKQLLKRITTLSENMTENLEKESGVKSSLQGEELQNYINDVISEMKGAENRGDSH